MSPGKQGVPYGPRLRSTFEDGIGHLELGLRLGLRLGLGLGLGFGLGLMAGSQTALRFTSRLPSTCGGWGWG